MLIPVARLALEAGHEVVFLGLTTARVALVQAGIPAIGFADLWPFAAARARGFGAELAAGLPTGGPVAPGESEAYLGISFADLVDAQGEAAARRLYEQRGRHAFLPRAFLRRVLEHIRPDLVVATNSPRAEQAALLAAGDLGLPSLCAVDLFAMQEVQWIGQRGYANRICVLNEQVRQMFLRHGRGEAEVVVTGNPAFDRLRDPALVSVGRDQRRARGWDDGKTTVLWASQAEPARHPFDDRIGDPSLPRQVERVLRQVIADHPELRLVVRYHPSEQIVFEAQDRVSLSRSDEPLVPLLHAVDVVVVTASTVGLEAALAGRPVVSVDCSVFTADAPYAAMGVSTGVESPAALPGALLTLVREGRASGTPGGAGAEAAGEAAHRILQVIESLSQRSLK